MNAVQEKSYNRIADLKLKDKEAKDQDENEIWLTDLLVDLWHWADEVGLDFHAILKWAGVHYTAEVNGEDL